MRYEDVGAYIEKMPPGMVTCVDLPRRVPAGAYETAAVKISSALSREPGVHSVFQFGAVKVPGISDLDLVAVFEPGRTRLMVDPTAGLDDNERYTLMHGLFALPLPVYSQLHLLVPINTMVQRWGTLPPPPPLPLNDEESVLLLRLQASRYLVEGLFNLGEQFLSHRLNTRKLLCILRGLAQDLIILGNPRGPLIRDSIDEIRNNWWDDPDESIRSFPSLCRSFYFEALSTVGMNGLGFPDTLSSPRAIYMGPGRYIMRDPGATHSLLEMIPFLGNGLAGARWVDRSCRHPRNGARMMIRLSRGLFLVLPEHRDGFTDSQINLLPILTTRKAILDNYSIMMRGTSPQFGMLQVGQETPSRGFKNGAIRNVNMALARHGCRGRGISFSNGLHRE
jgi:hypothetical protein